MSLIESKNSGRFPENFETGDVVLYQPQGGEILKGRITRLERLSVVIDNDAAYGRVVLRELLERSVGRHIEKNIRWPF